MEKDRTWTLAALLAKRLAWGLVTLWLVSVLIFAATELLPGDVASAILGQNQTPETVAALRERLGLDRPAPVRYVQWLAEFAQGHLGTSLVSGRPIAPELMERLANTTALAALAAAIAVPVALVLGLLTATFQGSYFDRSVNMVTLVSISLPEFLIGYVLIVFLSVEMGLFPSIAIVGSNMGFWERVYTMTLPAATLVFAVTAHMMRMVRATVADALTATFIETAILKGLPVWRIVLVHALPNAVGPIFTVVAINLAYLIVGVVVVEVIFVYPGLGQYMVDSVARRDLPVIQACSLIFAGVYIIINLTADLLSLASNPRLWHAR